MPGDDLFKRYLEIGASVLGMSRDRAEAIVKDLVASGEVAKGQATKAADWLVERGRAGTDELAEIVRREIRQQVAAMGLATKDDIARLEAQLQASAPAAPGAATASAVTPAAPARPRPRARAASAEAGNGNVTPSTPAASRAGKAAGITKAGSVKRGPAPGRPAGKAAPPRG